MSNNVICIKGLNPSVTTQLLSVIFDDYGPIQRIDIYDDEAGARCANLSLSSKEKALLSIEEMNGKEILRNKIQIGLLTESEGEIIAVDKEKIGEVIYPLALKKYGKHAPKLTGMLIEAILAQANGSNLNEILNSDKTLKDLIDAAFQKLTK